MASLSGSDDLVGTLSSDLTFDSGDAGVSCIFLKYATSLSGIIGGFPCGVVCMIVLSDLAVVSSYVPLICPGVAISTVVLTPYVRGRTYYWTVIATDNI